ncbi:MAG: hypothetical protein N3I35_02210 [Clostridia bacterium]|nr:hypothetical protein [Clostridia bacterium]
MISLHFVTKEGFEEQFIKTVVKPFGLVTSLRFVTQKSLSVFSS